MVEYQVAGGAGAIRSWLQTEEPSGVMDCNDMDLFTNESVYDSIGALDHFSNVEGIDLWNDTPGLRQSIVA